MIKMSCSQICLMMPVINIMVIVNKILISSFLAFTNLTIMLLDSSKSFAQKFPHVAHA